MNWQNVTVKLSALQPWEQNPRSMTKKQAQRLLKSWQDLGQFQTIAIGPHGEVYDGHQRLSALLAAHGPQFAIDARQSDRELSDDERRYLTTQANLPVGQWNWDALAGWDAAQLQEWGFDDEALKTWNSDAANLATMLTAEQRGSADAEPQIDRAAELNEKWQVKTGDLWRIGEHRLLCGDSTNAGDVALVMQGEKASACVTDPPYAIFGSSTGVKSDVSDDNLIRPFFRELSKSVRENTKTRGHVYLFCDWRSFPVVSEEVGNALQIKNCLIWSKGEAGFSGSFYSNTYEMISLFVNEPRTRSMFNSYNETGTPDHKQIYKSNVLFYERVPIKDRDHFAEKPTELISELIENSTDGDDLVFEPFTGSGTALVACQNLQRKCRAIEISPNYCAVILERMATAFPGIEIDRLNS